MKNRLLCILVVFGALLTSAQSTLAAIKSDFVFLIDATGSMAGEIAAVKSGLSQFANGLDTAQIDARFSLILFGGAPELVLDFTSDVSALETAFGKISVSGAVSGFQNNHNVNPEAGLEAIRIALGAATDNTLLRNNVGGSGGIVFRSDARKNVILVTDEDSDLPFYSENRLAGQTTLDPPGTIAGTNWQTEVDNTADAIIDNNAFINLLINRSDAPSISQYGDPNQDVSDSDFLNFDPDATLANLQNAGLGNCLEAQVLDADLIGRSFNIADVNDADFIDNFFAAKIEETEDNPLVPEPASLLVWSLLGTGCCGALGRRRRMGEG